MPAPPPTVTVTVNACLVVMLGEDGVTVTVGVIAFAVTLKVKAFEAPPPGEGFVTVTEGVPALATSEARIAAVTFVALTNVVVRAFPLKLTTDPLTKLEPFTVNVNAPEPAVALDGCSEVITGTGFEVAAPSWLMVKI